MRNALLRVMTSFRHGGFTQPSGFAIERSRNIKWETLWVACRATFECCCFTCRGEVRPSVSTINYTQTYQMCTSDILWTEPACNSESSEKPNRTCLCVWLMQTINSAPSVSNYTVSVSTGTLTLGVSPLQQSSEGLLKNPSFSLFPPQSCWDVELLEAVLARLWNPQIIFMTELYAVNAKKNKHYMCVCLPVSQREFRMWL